VRPASFALQRAWIIFAAPAIGGSGGRDMGRTSNRRSEQFAGAFGVACLLIWVSAALAGNSAAVPDRQVVHLLNRAAFGPTLDELRYVKTVGIERYIAEQLDPESIPEPIELRWQLAQLDTLKLNPVQLRHLYGPIRVPRGFKLSPELEKARSERVRVILRDAREARIFRAVLSRRQLQEVMVDFWFNHFNVFSGKGLADIWIGSYEQQTIRPFVLGRFRDLLFATAKHPAMLVYLDNSMSSAPGSPGAQGNKTGLNENFAREVMELHTLGADGGYTQEDVVTLARILTGWGINSPDAREFPEHAAVFEGARHDYGAKVFLGHPLKSRGKAEGEEALDMLARSPATARHISRKLAQYFVADDPSPDLVERLAARFLETDGNIRELLKTIFASREFWESSGRKYKTPYQFLISAVRAAGVPFANPRPLLGMMDQLGMPLYGCLTPDGYKNTEEAWLSPDATTRRIGFATALARGAVVTPAGHPADADHLQALLGSTLADTTREAIADSPRALRAALILGSPDFMRR
jgi:uncharacterized protein (DUF1800 family)